MKDKNDGTVAVNVNVNVNIPHRGYLCKVQIAENSDTTGGVLLHSDSMIYAITIQAEVDMSSGGGGFNNSMATRTTHELHFKLEHYTFMERIFSILDTESKGVVRKDIVEEFVMLRCPVFKRRDYDLLQYEKNNRNRGDGGIGTADAVDLEVEDHGHYYGEGYLLDDGYGESLNFDQQKSLSTFEEVWNATFSCACTRNQSGREQMIHYGAESVIGIEAWMVFCQFISLAQYHDAKRRFSGRHLQTLQKKYSYGSSGSGSGSVIVEGEDQEQEQGELIIVDLPPLEKPVPLDAHSLLQYSHSTKDDGGIPLPELDLDHSYISLHDESKKLQQKRQSLELNPTLIGDHGHNRQSQLRPIVQVSVFGNESDMKSHSSPQPGDQLEFIIRYIPEQRGSINDDGIIIVRRSFEDLEWLHDTFKSHKQLGGTLCGRILPPFPSRLDSNSGGTYDEDDYSSYGYNTISSSLGSIATTSKKTSVAVASAGVGMVSSAAKTAKSLIWGKSKSKSPISSVVKKAAKLSGIKSTVKSTSTNNTDSNHSFDIKAQYSKRYSYAKNSSNTPSCKARQLERYLNYMLEHPALSTSFPLNLILKASQSGLEAAKNILDDQLHNQFGTPNLNDGSVNSIGDIFTSYSSVLKYLPSPTHTKNLKWVRTAAQAALVLQVHGLLETAGYQSTSTKLQHASLPQFASSKARDSGDSNGSMDDGNDKKGDEEGDSCLLNYDGCDDDCDGFDVLPEPLPLSERSALCAGRSLTCLEESGHKNIQSSSSNAGIFRGDHYGMYNNNTSLGDIDVEKDTVRLRDLLRKVDKSFSLCCKAMSAIGENRHGRAQLQMNILRSIDNWEGMRGKILAQRSLLNGVNSLEKANRRSDDCYVAFSEDMLWNASLASSAVSASDEVCDAVNAAKTATRAKKTADTAVFNLGNIEKEVSERPEEKKNFQEQGSKLRMQALHAAVLEHEADSAKKRSVVSLANDVKYWNSHRKRELLNACTKIAKAQKFVSEQNLKAWNELKDGLLECPHFVQSKVVIPEKLSKGNDAKPELHQENRNTCLPFEQESHPSEVNISQSTYTQEDMTEADDLHDECHSLHTHAQKESVDTLVQDSIKVDCLFDQAGLDAAPVQESQRSDEYFHHLEPTKEGMIKIDSPRGQGSIYSSHSVNHSLPCPSLDPELNEIASDAQQDYFTPTPSEHDDTICGDQNHSVSDYADAQDSNEEDFEYTDKNSATTLRTNIDSELLVPVKCDGENEHTETNLEREYGDDGMTDSMQSLVDGLLQWGGNWEDDDMNINLPQGMAASLVMENRGVLDLQ